jgi:hypothetical protein
VACRLLKGDRFAAAEVLNEASLFRQVNGPGDARLLKSTFASDAVVDWNGERNKDPLTAEDFWAAKATEGGHTNLFFESVEGETANRVRLRGFLSRYREGPGDQSIYEKAQVEQVWSTRFGDDFAIERATVGPFLPDARR